LLYHNLTFLQNLQEIEAIPISDPFSAIIHIKADFKVKLHQIESNFELFYQEAIKTPCSLCNEIVPTLYHCTCLLCGQVICLIKCGPKKLRNDTKPKVGNL